jgi:hypothetical protein
MPKPLGGTDTERRKRQKRVAPILVNGQTRFWKEVVLRPEEQKNLQIDESYQRRHLRPWVNELVSVLESGGVIPDPIVVAVRPNGERYIIEGQQRYWAHWACHKELRARLFKVETIEEEKALFLAYNNRRPVGATVTVKAFPGEGGALIRWLEEDGGSPLRGDIGFNSQDRVPASTIAKGLLLALKGPTTTARIQHVMADLTACVDDDRGRTYKMAQMYGLLIGRIFQQGQRVPSMPARALGLAAHVRWGGSGVTEPWPLPSGQSLRSLRSLKWEEWAPDNRARWLGLLRDEILKRWPK